MRKGTSGFLYTQKKDGGIRLEVVDYGVEELGGRDWESWYDLSKENAALLVEELSKLHSGSFEETFAAEFGQSFDTRRFEKFCKEHNIAYNHMTW